MSGLSGEHWAVRDLRTGATYPQPNKLIAEKVAEMHGDCEVIPGYDPSEKQIERALNAWVKGDFLTQYPESMHFWGPLMRDALTAAGVYHDTEKMREAQERAWDEGHTHCFHVEDPNRKDRNPYKKEEAGA